MAERPILFSGRLVRAILEGRKTQTRRVIQPQPPEGMLRHCWFDAPKYGWTDEPAPARFWYTARCPYDVDQLYVREAWRVCAARVGEPVPVEYRADGATVEHPWPELGGVKLCAPDKWRPGIHLPKWGSRIWLEVTGIRVERLQDISEADALAEGTAGAAPEDTYDSARAEFAATWDAINAPRGYGWAANPWLWVIDFKVAEVRGV